MSPVHGEYEKDRYRSLLQAELEQRRERNPHYSLRAMARDLDLAPARLSDVLRGRYGLSRKAAQAIGKKLDWSPGEQAHFCDLVDAAHSRAKKDREKAKEKIAEFRREGRMVSLDEFQVIADPIGREEPKDTTRLDQFPAHNFAQELLGVGE